MELTAHDVGVRTFPDMAAFPLDELLRLKRNARVRDVVGVRPLYVSVVVPTRREEDRQPLRQSILRRTLEQLGPVVERGLVNELLFVDGTTDAAGEPDLGWIDRITSMAIEEIAVFRREVEFLRENPGVEEKAQAGHFDLSVKVLHQWDGAVNTILSRYAVVPLERDPALPPATQRAVPMGKGAALWLASAAARGDIVAFVDSDVRNFSHHFVEGLLGPILESYGSGTDAVRYVKAYYKRLGVVDVEGEPHAKLGGRVTRLLARPAFEALAHHGLFRGLDSLDYPLSGEYAATRDVVEEIGFPNGYGVEVSTLCQVFQNFGPHAMAQVNFELFQHLSQTESSTDAMAADIAATLLHFARRYYGTARIERDVLVRTFEDKARALVDIYESFVKREADSGAPVVFERDAEFARIRTYAEALRNAESRIDLLPHWRSIEEMPRIRREIRKRTIVATSEALARTGALPAR